MSESAPIRHPTWLTSGDFTEADEPLRLFAAWFDEATRSEPRDPTAMSLATVDADGLPNVRMVLMKGFDERGFVFYTNVDSLRLRGPVARVDDAEADAYFATRPRLAQIGAWASNQSAPLESRHAFEQAIALHTAKFVVRAIPRPPNWTGYRLLPLIMEFWQDRPFRLHDRVEFRRAALGVPWRKTRLYP
jgi:pyridoxamine 5'-phosphate oxidase